MIARTQPPVPTFDEIVDELAGFGVTHVGVTTAEVLDDALAAIRDRCERDLINGMRFTFKNPERSTDPRASMPTARSIIVTARPYLTEADPPSPDHLAARIGRYAWEDHYALLRAGLRQVGRRIKQAGHRSMAFADDNAMVDRAVAYRAGLGWYGKNANLLIPGAGSFFVLGSLVTTAEYEPTESQAADGCGSCVRCLQGCPTEAIIEPGVIDAARCLSWILQKPGVVPERFRTAIGDRIYGCDDCQDTCPISVRLGRRNTIQLSGDTVAWADLEWLLTASDKEIEERHGYWYVAERNMRWLRRNALVVLGNIARPDNTTAIKLLTRYRTGDDPILADHAEWALERLHVRSATEAGTDA